MTRSSAAPGRTNAAAQRTQTNEPDQPVSPPHRSAQRHRGSEDRHCADAAARRDQQRHGRADHRRRGHDGEDRGRGRHRREVRAAGVADGRACRRHLAPANLSYHKDALGIVWLRPEPFTIGTTIAAGVTLATLPAGCRPGSRPMCPSSPRPRMRHRQPSVTTQDRRGPDDPLVDDPLVLFAANLRRLREEAGLSQEELGLRTGIDVSNISRYESAMRDPSVRTVARLAPGLRVDAGRLLDGL